MKSDLNIRKFQKIPSFGTRTAKEIKSFFGSKLIDIEDNILINNISIQYYDVPDDIGDINEHYQNFVINNMETRVIRSLDDVKFENHTININSNYNNNLSWVINIDSKKILRDYLFLRLKESRIFKCIKNENLKNRNIDNYIYDYIDINLLNRYNINYIKFYTEYFSVGENTNKLINDPKFNKNVYYVENEVKNINITTPDYLNNLGNVKMIYNQIKLYQEYKFDYYFTIAYKKI